MVFAGAGVLMLITIRFAKDVSKILAELPPSGQAPQTKYKFLQVTEVPNSFYV